MRSALLGSFGSNLDSSIHFANLSRSAALDMPILWITSSRFVALKHRKWHCDMLGFVGGNLGSVYLIWWTGSEEGGTSALPSASRHQATLHANRPHVFSEIFSIEWASKLNFTPLKTTRKVGQKHSESVCTNLCNVTSYHFRLHGGCTIVYDRSWTRCPPKSRSSSFCSLPVSLCAAAQRGMSTKDRRSRKSVTQNAQHGSCNKCDESL